MPSNLALLGAGGSGVVYLLRDEFTTAAAAPLASPRTCEPGPGTLTIVDTNNIASITGGKLRKNGTPAVGDKTASGSAITRAAGRAILWEIANRTTLGANNLYCLLHSVTNTQSGLYGFRYSSTTTIAIRASGVGADTAVLGAGVHEFALIMRATGALLFGRNGGSGSYSLLYVFSQSTADLFWYTYLNVASAVDYQEDNVRAVDFPLSYQTPTDQKATSANSDTITMPADAWVFHTITAATGVTQELMVRRVDDNNCWIIRMDQAGGTIRIFEKVAGVETQQSSLSQTWTNATQYRVGVLCTGTTIKSVVADTAKNSYTSASSFQSSTGVKVSNAGTDLQSWAYSVTLPTY